MNIRDTIDRVRHTRISKPDDSEHEKKSHDEMAKKYEEKKKFHNAHNQNRPKEESAKEKVLKSVFSHGKKLAVKARQKAQEEALRQGKKQKKSKKSKSKKIKSKQKSEPREEYSGFSFGFDNQSNEQFGFGMFTPKKQEERPKQQDVDWSKVFNFRMDSDSKKRHYNNFGGF